MVRGINLVHNGIIENYLELKEELIKSGAQISSDTDSELVAHLINREIHKGCDLLKSVLAVLPQLRGAFSILVVNEDQPDVMVAFKNGPPLLVGLAEDSVIVASDAQAIVNETKKIVYLEDYEIAHIQKADVQFLDTSGHSIKKEIDILDWSEEMAEKGGYSHYMLKEIFEQPRAVSHALAPHIDLKSHKIDFQNLGISIEELKKIERIFIIACGTSYYAGCCGKYIIESMSGIPVETDIASEFRYRSPIVPKNSLAIMISQSGETADTLAVLRQLKDNGRHLPKCL